MLVHAFARAVTEGRGTPAAVGAFVRLYEEPTPRARHGEADDAYRPEVPGWWPRLRG